MPHRPLYNYVSLVLAAMMPLISQAQQDQLSESAERLEALEETAQGTPEPEKGSWKSQFIDKEDGWLDGSEFLIENAYGFLPVPIIITEPAVDNGLGLAGIFFHKPKPDDPKPEEGEFLMTDVSAVAAAYTGNDSWFLGGGHFNTWRQDTRRYTGVVGYADINLDYYGTEDGPPVFDQGIGFNAKGFFTDQEVLFRLGETRWFLGGEWRYLNSDVTINTGFPIIDDLLSDEDTISGLGLVTLYEKLDSRFSPTKGISAHITARVNDEAIGSDYDFEELTWKIRQYFTFAEKYTFSWRIDGATTNGDVPFYLEPFVNIEGIPAMRYQGPTAVTAEIRGGYDIHPRWTLMAFGGGGRTGETISDIGSAQSHTAVGVGFRYLLAKLMGMRAGIDIARGPEDTYIYIVTGSAW